MSRNRTPSYRHHRATNQAVVTIRVGNGKRKDIYLGQWKSKESRAAYARIIAECESSSSGFVTDDKSSTEMTVNEILVAFLCHAKKHYRHADGTLTSEYEGFILSIRTLRRLYGFTRAAEFGPLSLKAVREQFIREGIARKTINQRIGRIKRIFKWATAEELIPPATFHGLQTVVGLQVGRTAAKERAPILPVAESVVSETLPFLPRHVAGLVRFQLATGCRPGEACSIRRVDIDTTGPIWTYRPPHHKLAYRGTARVIAIGPKAQAVLAEFPTDRPEDFIFSAARSMNEIRAAKLKERITPRWPSHMERNERKRLKSPKRRPADWYQSRSYANAVSKGVVKANKWREKTSSAGDFVPVPHWHPNQLRHTHATKVRSQFGLEAAQVALGHARADVTQIYAEKNLALAAEVAAKVG